MCIIHWTTHPACNCEHIHRIPTYCDAFAIAHPQYTFSSKLITYIPALADLHLDRDGIHFRGHLLGEEKRPDGLSCPELETRFELPPEEGEGCECPLCGMNSDVVMTMQEAKLCYEERVDWMERRQRGYEEKMALRGGQKGVRYEKMEGLMEDWKKLRREAEVLEARIAENERKMGGDGNGAAAEKVAGQDFERS